MITVTSVYAAAALVQSVGAALSHEFTAIFREFEKELPKEQIKWWAQRFNAGVRHSRTTVKERNRALGREARAAVGRKVRPAKKPSYYTENPADRIATSNSPYYFWTGNLLKSTAKLTTIGGDGLSARILTGVNYTGPLARVYSDPVESIMVRGRKPVDPWDVPRLDIVMDEKIEEGLKRIVGRVG